MSGEYNYPIRVAPPDSYIYGFDDPERYGPGVWMMFMLSAIRSKSREQCLFVCINIRDFAEFFGCPTCRKHCQEYIAENPPENSAANGDLLFKWVVKFCNSVYIRIGKPIFDTELIYKKFARRGRPVCEGTCDEEFPIQRTQQTSSRSYVDQNVEQRQTGKNTALRRAEAVTSSPYYTGSSNYGYGSYGTYTVKSKYSN